MAKFNRIALLLVVATLACGEDNPIETGGAPERKVAFVTADRFTGDFGSIADADAVCQSRADSAGLAGNYGAWLSATVDALDGVSDAVFVRTDGEMIA
ncbi:MAG: hypothetical protein AAFY60_21495, partial [Myxococcota bacterium]